MDAAQHLIVPPSSSSTSNLPCFECLLSPDTVSAVPRARFYRVHFTNALWGKKFYDKLALLGT